MHTKRQSNLTSRVILFCLLRPKASKGFILFTVIALLIALSGLWVAYAILSKVHGSSANSTASSNSGFYASEAVLNTRADGIRRILLSNRKPNGTSPSSMTDCLTPGSTNIGTGDYACRSQVLTSPNNSMSKAVAYSYIVPKEEVNGTVPPGDTFQGLNMIESRYSISAVSKKESSDADQLLAITELVVKSRLIPVFQFAAFYANDLEILPGPTMNLNGPVHTNGSLFLGANNNNGLNIVGQVTTSADIFNKRKNDNSTYPNGRVRIANALGTLINLLSNGTGSTSPTTNRMVPSLITGAWGTQVQTGVQTLAVPTISSLGSGGNFAGSADIQILYTPPATSTGSALTSPNPISVPFTLTAIKRQANGTATSTETLDQGKLRSLRQPVMVPSSYGFCTVASPVVGLSSVDFNSSTSGTNPPTAAQLTAIAKYLYAAIVAQTRPMAYDTSHVASSTFGATNRQLINDATLTDDVVDTLNLLIDRAQEFQGMTSSARTALKTALAGSRPDRIAALDNYCFIPAPLQDIGRNATNHNSPYHFFNNRENKEIRLLQINLRSLTAWNSDGLYWTFDSATPPVAVIPTTITVANLLSTNQTLFNRAAVDSGAPSGSFQRLGLAASDVSHDGLVIHASISNTTYTSSASDSSPYAFALVQGGQLPGLAETTTTLDPTGLTFVSDQAVYLVGDYNNFNWQPASVLADSLNILSRICLNADFSINKNSGTNCTGGNPVDTFVNTALLAGTDITNSAQTPGYNGGLENYPRFSENWGGITLTYRGSFVSTGIPLHVSGTWGNQQYGAPNRNWDYDSRFNLAKNLPPLTPRFVFLKQESFTRNFDQ